MHALILALALLQAPASPWVPAATDMEDQTCGLDAHRHVLDLKENGHYVVNKEKGEPDIVFDGLCHYNKDEKLVKDPERKVLPVPKPAPKEKS